MRRPFQGAVVTYHDQAGVLRYGIVTHTADSIDPVAVRVGALPPITSPVNCHIDVYRPGGYRAYYDVAPGDQPGQWAWPL